MNTNNPFFHRAAEQQGGVEIIESGSLEFVTDPVEYAERLQMLLRRGKLVEQTEQDRAAIAAGNWKRVSNLMVCKLCNKSYMDHPALHQYAILTKLCNGDLVKL